MTDSKAHACLAVVLLALFSSAQAWAETSISTETLRLTFGASGELQSAIACFPSCSADEVRIQQFGGDGVVNTGGPGSGSWSQRREPGDGYVDLVFRHTSGVERSWRIPQRGYRLGLAMSDGGGLRIQSGDTFRPREAAGFGTWLEQARYVVMDEDGVTQVGYDDTEVEPVETGRWLGYRNRFWTLMALPPGRVNATLSTAEDQQDAGIDVSGIEGNWSFYIGPIEPRALKQQAAGLEDILYAGLWFWLRWICFGLFYLLGAIKMVIPSWGLAVMVLSLAVHILMLPLSRIADRFQQQVNETEARLAPELQRIKKNFKGEKQAAKILALYKTERVHPLYSLKSLMGVAVVIPVFIGAFDMLAENIHLLNTGFLWIADMSRPDAVVMMPFSLPFFGSDLNLLPFLMTGLSVVASALHKPLALNAELRRKQVINMLLLAVAFFVLFYTFPAGMVLYWTTNNLISVSKSLWARR